MSRGPRLHNHPTCVGLYNPTKRKRGQIMHCSRGDERPILAVHQITTGSQYTCKKLTTPMMTIIHTYPQLERITSPATNHHVSLSSRPQPYPCATSSTTRNPTLLLSHHTAPSLSGGSLPCHLRSTRCPPLGQKAPKFAIVRWVLLVASSGGS